MPWKNLILSFSTEYVGKLPFTLVSHPEQELFCLVNSHARPIPCHQSKPILQINVLRKPPLATESQSCLLQPPSSHFPVKDPNMVLVQNVLEEIQ